MPNLAWTNPHPFIEIVGHCYAEFGHPAAHAPNEWQMLGVPEVLAIGTILPFTGRFHQSRPVIYMEGRPDARLSWSGFKLLEQHPGPRYHITAIENGSEMKVVMTSAPLEHMAASALLTKYPKSPAWRLQLEEAP